MTRDSSVFAYNEKEDSPKMVRQGVEYTHFKMRDIPFEDEIVAVDYNCNIPFSDRREWLNDMIFFFKNKPYFAYAKDFFGVDTHYDDDNQAPHFAIYLKGVLDAAYIEAYLSCPESIVKFVETLLKRGHITVTKYIRGPHLGKYHFTFSPLYYSYISAEERLN